MGPRPEACKQRAEPASSTHDDSGQDKKNKEALRESERKWGKPAIDAGFTVLPSILLQKQHALGLDCIDLALIFQIAKHWWYADQAPYPSQIQLAETMSLNLSTVKRHLNRLRRDKLITWKGRSNKHGGQAANAYDLSGLIEKLDEFAREELAARAEAADARKARAAKKRPGKPVLRVVKNTDG